MHIFIFVNLAEFKISEKVKLYCLVTLKTFFGEIAITNSLKNRVIKIIINPV